LAVLTDSGSGNFATTVTTLNGVPLQLIATASAVRAVANPVETPSLVVNTLADIVNQFDNLTSLREAIALANTRAGADIITFAAALSGQTITLSGSPLGLTQNGAANKTTITGPSGGMTISGNNLVGILDVGTNVFAELLNLTLTRGNRNGAPGGANFNAGTLDLIQCVISNNVSSQGGGIANGSGTLTPRNSTVRDNATVGEANAGGGIFSNGNLTIIGSTISGNFSNDGFLGDGGGGGIYVVSTGRTLTLINSTVSGNSALANGGGINVGFGANATIVNSTITNNRSSSAGGAANGGGLWIRNNAGTVTVQNTIVAGNSNGTGSTPNDIQGAVAADFSLIGNTTGATITVGNNLVNVDPMLGPLANNGGPTMTHALLANSPARNAGLNSLLQIAMTADQRGQTRISGGTVDIGAVEMAMTPTVIRMATPKRYALASAGVLSVAAAQGLLAGVTTTSGQPLHVTSLTGPSGVTLTFQPNGAFTLRTSLRSLFTLRLRVSDGISEALFEVTIVPSGFRLR
jgi:CSLREA domain-containing protein